jgi:hypothetical protein
MAARPQRISIGFLGGQVLSLRVEPTALKALQKALGEGGWHEVEAQDGAARVNVAQVAYVRVDSDEPHVGFGA